MPELEEVSYWSNAGLMAISEKGLSRAPEAIKRYVRRFFKRGLIFKSDGWVAISTPRFISRTKNEKGRGLAPCEALRVTQFTKAFTGKELLNVITGLEKGSRQCFCLCSVSGDKGCVGIIEND